MKKRKRFSEHELPQRNDKFLKESAIFSRLAYIENRLDNTLDQKLISIYSNLDPPPTSTKILRLYIFNTYANQAVLAENQGPPEWILKIQGHVYDKITKVPEQSPSYLFTNVLKRLTVQFDSNLYSEPDNFVEWRKTHGPAISDGFEIRRAGDTDTECKITLHFDSLPEQFRVSKVLSAIIQISVGTKAQIIRRFWAYVKNHDLLIPNDPTRITIDEKLRHVFSNKDTTHSSSVSSSQPLQKKAKVDDRSMNISNEIGTISVASIVGALRAHMSPPDSLHIKYTVRTSGNERDYAQCYDISIPSVIRIDPTLLDSKKHPPARPRAILNLDGQMDTLLASLHLANRKREYLQAFADNPTETMISLLQTLHMRSAQYRATPRHAQFYQNAEWIHDAIDRYFLRQESVKSQAYEKRRAQALL